MRETHTHGVYRFDPTHIAVSVWTETERGSTVLSVVSHYREAKSFYSISAIMAMHPPLLKSICFYLMPQLFPDALFFTLNTNLPLHLFLSPPPSPGSVAPCPLSSSSLNM